jgi:hypothetical protein
MLSNNEFRVCAGVRRSGRADCPCPVSHSRERYLSRQTVALGGGSNEMARNVIGERVLGFPREYAADRDVPFNQVTSQTAVAAGTPFVWDGNKAVHGVNPIGS